MKSSANHLSPQIALWHLGIKQTLKGAIVIGVLAGFIAVVQGWGYISTYPDEKSRAAFATTLESAPALGILYGETKNLASGAGYMVYRTVPFMALIASIWGLMTVTKLLRGQEEDGRWEIVTSASTTPRQASALLIGGFATSLLCAFSLSSLIILFAGMVSEMTVSLITSMLIALVIFLPAALFASLGILTSQLSITRRRALMYGLGPLITFFTLRAVANTLPDLYWLKSITPFGWSDLVSPVFDQNALWLIPFIIVTPLFIATGILLTTQRDLGAGLLHESTSRKSRFYLLGSATQLALRYNLGLFTSWATGALAMSILLASIMTVAAEAVADSPSLGGFIGQLGGSVNDMKVAFLGAGLMFVVILLLIMAAVCMGGIRKDEAKNYLDNLLTQPISRSSWLVKRLLLIVAAFTSISIICAMTTWAMAHLQDVSLDLGTMLLISIALTGTVVFTLGLGTLLYGILPRIAAIGMYLVVIWSFVIDIIGSVIALDDIVLKSSLLHYVSLSPTVTPDWSTFGWLTGLGIVMSVIGVVAFTKRDIIAE